MRDLTQATALDLAKRHLEKMGWKYSPEDIGRTAAKIIRAMDADLVSAES